MQRILTSFLIFILLLSTSISAQKRKTTPSKAASKSVAKREESAPATKISPIIGSTITITTKNGDKLTGELLDLTAFSLRLKEKNLESTIALETIAAISLDPSKSAEIKAPQPISGNFAHDASAAFKAFQNMEAETKSGSDYTTYGRQLIELRREVEKFVQKYCRSENPTEARIVSLLSGALIEYTEARTIWTLKLGGNGTVSEAENPVLSDILALYPEFRAATAVGDRFSADKLIGNLWKRASEKTATARSGINQ